MADKFFLTVVHIWIENNYGKIPSYNMNRKFKQWWSTIPQKKAMKDGIGTPGPGLGQSQNNLNLLIIGPPVSNDNAKNKKTCTDLLLLKKDHILLQKWMTT